MGCIQSKKLASVVPGNGKIGVGKNGNGKIGVGKIGVNHVVEAFKSNLLRSNSPDFLSTSGTTSPRSPQHAMDKMNSDEKAIDRGGKHSRIQPMARMESELYAKNSLGDDYDDKEVIEADPNLNADARRFIYNVLKRHYIFSGLFLSEYYDGMMERMKLVEYKEDELIFKQGEPGDACYIVAQGTFNVYIDSQIVNTLKKGASFGELSILYLCDRTASVRCEKGGKCWELSGQSVRLYRNLLLQRNKNQVMQYLSTEPYFKYVTEDDKHRLAAVCDLNLFQDNEKFVREGEGGNCIYLILKGKAELYDRFGNVSVEKKGAILGDIGFDKLNNFVSAKAVGETCLLAFPKDVVTREFGTLHDVLELSGNKKVLNESKTFCQFLPKQIETIAHNLTTQSFQKNQMIVSNNSKSQFIMIKSGDSVLLTGQAEKVFLSKVHEEDTLDDEPDPIIVEDKIRQIKQKALDNEPDHLYLGSRTFYGEENIYLGERMKGTLVATSDLTVVKRIGLDAILALFVPEKERMRSVVNNCKGLLRINKVMSVLSDIFIFKSITRAQLDKVAYALRDVSFRPGEVIFREGEKPEDGLYLITDGSLTILSSGKVIRTLGKWDYFGERALLLQEPRSADCVAQSTGCRCLILAADVFLEIVGRFRKLLESRIKLQDSNIGFNDLDIAQIVGRGTFGVVYLVYHKDDLSRRYALKCVMKKSQSTAQKKFLLIERSICAQCFHPCIMQFIRTFQDSTRLYFLTEFLGGGDLFTAIREIGMLNYQQVTFFSGSIILAIEYLHERGIMYRDLKPENVLLDELGNTKLVDFGCCRQQLDIPSHSQRTYTFVGTLEYLAPEVILAKGYNCVADWWSFGVVVYEFIVGPHPFGRQSDDRLEVYQQILEAPLAFPDYVEDRVAIDFITKLLTRRPQSRLGGGAMGAKEIRNHKYFDGFDWDALAGGYMEKPWVPVLREDKVTVSSEPSEFRVNKEPNWEPENWCKEF